MGCSSAHTHARTRTWAPTACLSMGPASHVSPATSLSHVWCNSAGWRQPPPVDSAGRTQNTENPPLFFSHFSSSKDMKAISQSLPSFSLLLPPSTCSSSSSSSSSLSQLAQFDQSLVSLYMDSAQWPQDIGLLKPMEEPAASSAGVGAAATGYAASSSGASRLPQAAAATAERRARPHKEQALSCPRCNSTNTKFCYYNNYSLTQPRYFCKTCRRYWTEGGSLRNVPVGGGSRKNKRSSLSSSSSSSSAAAVASSSTAAAASSSIATKNLATDHHHHLIPPPISLSTASQAPKFHEGQDLNLAFPHHGQHMPEFADFPGLEINANTNGGTSNTTSALSAMQLLSSGIAARGGLGPFMSMPVAAPEYPSGFSLHDFRPPTLGFSLDGMVTGATGGGGSSSGGYGMVHDSSGGGSSLLFPFEDLKPPASNAAADQEQFDQQINRGQSGDHPGFWGGVIGGGGSW